MYQKIALTDENYDELLPATTEVDSVELFEKPFPQQIKVVRKRCAIYENSSFNSPMGNLEIQGKLKFAPLNHPRRLSAKIKVKEEIEISTPIERLVNQHITGTIWLNSPIRDIINCSGKCLEIKYDAIVGTKISTDCVFDEYSIDNKIYKNLDDVYRDYPTFKPKEKI